MASKEIVQKLVGFYRLLEKEKAFKEQPYLENQVDERLQLVEDQMELLGHGVKQDELKGVVNDIGEEVKAAYEVLHKLNDKFSLVVLGNGNTGKSTIINALIGQEVAKMKDTPMTWRVDVFHNEMNQGEHKAEIIYEQGGIIDKKVLSIEEAKALIEAEEAKREAAKKEQKEAFDNEKKRIRENAKREKLSPIIWRKQLDEAEARFAAEKGYISPITEVRWHMQDSEILDDFQIIDTPGLTQDLGRGGFEKSMIDYYKEADGILCMLDINKVHENNAILQLNKLNEELQNQDISFEKAQIIGVLNRTDQIRESHEIVRLKEEAEKIYEGVLQEIIPVSAKMALSAVLTSEVPPEESGFGTLKKCIYQNFLYYNKGLRIQKSRELIEVKEKQIMALANRYKKLVQQYKEEEQCMLYELQKEIRQVQERLRARIKYFLDTYEAQVLAKIEQEIEQLFASGTDPKEVLQEQIFALEDLKQHIKCVQDEMKQALSDSKKEQLECLWLKDKKHDMLNQSIVQYIASHNIDIEDIDIGEMNILGYFQQVLLGFLNQYQVVQYFVNRIFMGKYKEQLKENLEKIKTEVNSELEKILVRETEKIIREIELSIHDKFKIENESYIDIVASIEDTLSKPIKRPTLVMYIKGVKYETNSESIS